MNGVTNRRVIGRAFPATRLLTALLPLTALVAQAADQVTIGMQLEPPILDPTARRLMGRLGRRIVLCLPLRDGDARATAAMSR
jgi:hypothetical protein